MKTVFCPRIYTLRTAYLETKISADHSAWDSLFCRCVAMGFDHILIEFPITNASTRSSPDVVAIANQLKSLLQACAKHGLSLLLDLTLNPMAANHPLPLQYPHYFSFCWNDENQAELAPLPDPRRRSTPSAWRFARLDCPEVTAFLQDYWQQQLKAFISVGVAGFRCLGLGHVPAAFWTSLISTCRKTQSKVHFLAWTCGTTPQQINALLGCGFDASFSSVPWWNFKSDWFTQEHARLMRLAPAIAFPECPEQDRQSPSLQGNEPALQRQLRLRSLQFSAAVGQGLMIPMGFEYGHCTQPSAPLADDTDLEKLQVLSGWDLSPEITAANHWVATLPRARLRILSSPNTTPALLLRGEFSSATGGVLILVNADPFQAQSISGALWRKRTRAYQCGKLLMANNPVLVHEVTESQLTLPAAAIRIYTATRAQPIVTAPRRKSSPAPQFSPRIAIEAVSPVVDNGRFAVKKVIGDTVHIEATLVIDGANLMSGALLWHCADQQRWQRIPMHPLGNDRWSAGLPLLRLGRYYFAIEAWSAGFATYRQRLQNKVDAHLDVSLDLLEGQQLVTQAAQEVARNRAAYRGSGLAAALTVLERKLTASNKPGQAVSAQLNAQIQLLLSPSSTELMQRADARPFAVQSATFPIVAERRAAQYGNWYELFPRSQSGDVNRHGSFNDVIERLPAIRAMGFDTLYLPPIHPIGQQQRKGRNNALTAQADDPGSPYAIGSARGGHEAIHPQLGTLQDFRRLLHAAQEQGLELALDFAIQCSPDHPWVQQHPDWFDKRADGSLRHAENPPKLYQDIVSVDFYAQNAQPDLWLALRHVVLFWLHEGVRIFRVDNPHSKPLPFWEWLIADISSRYPDTIFLAEAFTRPAMMLRLAKIGFSQSYTYFIWRHSQRDFIDYLSELNSAPICHYFRPHFFVNTPDINPYFLQQSGRPGFLIRAALASTLSGLWGIYSGFELCESRALDGKEEYCDSEKYQLRAWDWKRPGNIIAEITQLNRIREANPALQSHLGIQFHPIADPAVLLFSKTERIIDDTGETGKEIDNFILIAICLDPSKEHVANFEAPLWHLGLTDDAHVTVEDLIHEIQFTWQGKYQQVTLDPFKWPCAIWRLSRQSQLSSTGDS